MFGKVEFRRTCTRDGTVWYVSKSERRMQKPNVFDHIAAGAFEVSGGGTRGATSRTAVMGRAAQYRALNTCPACGSKKFTEKKVKA
jgi:hypothetical protein